MGKTRYITTAILAERLNVSPQYIRKLIALGKIQASKLGHDWLIDEKTVSQLKRRMLTAVKEKTTCE